MSRVGSWVLCAALVVACDGDVEAPVAVDDAAAEDASVHDMGGTPPDVATPDAGTDVADTGGPPVETGPGLGIDYDALPAGAAPIFEPGGGSWLATGWPTDRLRGPDGGVDLSTFPNPGSDLLDSYIQHGMAVLDGWGLNGGVYFQLGGAVDPGSLPSPEETLDPLGAVQLVNVTAGSARYGEQVPVDLYFYAGGADLYYPEDTLVVRPVFGFGLSEGETWCAIVTRAVREPGGAPLGQRSAFTAALAGEPWLMGLNAWLDDSALHREDVAVASCFTTHRATGDLRAVVDLLDASEPPAVHAMWEPNVNGEIHGLYLAPNFQRGQKPYATSGGGLVIEDGVPVVQATEELRYLLLTPPLGEAPEAGWPTVIYAHGTGGDYESCRSVGRRLMEEGLAVLCIDQPLHGTRGPESGPLSDTELVTFSFNFLSPEAGRTSFRQAAIDLLILARMVEAGRFDVGASQSASGQPIRLDPTRVMLYGHSHGALSGSLALGVDPLLGGGVISGGGALLINTVLLRKDPLDIAALVAAVALVPPQYLDAFHPLLSMVQLLVDATDPVNYAPYWLRPAPGGTPKHMLVTEGTADHASPQLTGDTLGVAGRLPIIRPLAKQSRGHALLGLAPVDVPVSQNAAGGEVTAAMRQWQDGSHWVASSDAEAERLWRSFFRTWAASTAPEGGPVVLDGALSYSGAAVTPGEGCSDAAVIDPATLPVRLFGNTRLAADDLATSACTGGAEPQQRDHVFQLTADVAGAYRFTLITPAKLDEEDPPTGPDRLALAGDCADVEGTCLGSTGGSIERDLAAGETVFIVVDGSAQPFQGAYRLEVERSCEEVGCDGVACGWSGCDWCGGCAEGVCAENQCVPAAGGDRCEDALPVGALPFAATGDTAAYRNDYHYGSGTCPGFGGGYGAGSRDVIYRFAAPAAGVYTFQLDATYDANLYLVGDCADVAGTCLGASRVWSGEERLARPFEAGEVAHVVVDGAGNSGDSYGPYLLRIEPCVADCEGRACGDDGCGGSCGDCGPHGRCEVETTCDLIPYLCVATAGCAEVAPGDRCEDPFILTDSVSGNTGMLRDEYSFSGGACPGVGGGFGYASPDAVHRFTPPASGIYKVQLSASFDAALYVTTTCDTPSAGCLAADQVDKKGNERVYVSLTEGEAVDVIVDGATHFEHAGAYEVSVEPCSPSCDGKICGGDGCGGSCGSCGPTEACSGGQCGPRHGDLCSNPRGVGDLPFEHKGSTGGYTSAVADTCPGAVEGAGAAWADVVYRFVAPADETYRFSLSAGWSATLRVEEGCGAGVCAAVVAAGEPVDLALSEGEERFLVVDGAPAAPESASGSYTLRVDVACYPQCDGKQCGDDGCGGVCGSCVPPDDVCAPDGQCIGPDAVAGDTCAAPRDLSGTLPIEAEGDLDLMLNQYRFADLACSALTAKGGASPDEAWRFVADEAGVYRFEVAPAGFDAVLYAVSDCARVNETCLGAADGWPPEHLDLTFEAGEAVTLIVDGSGDVLRDAGRYLLRVSRL